MALTIDSTIAGETANSYISLAYCDDFWEQHYLVSKAAQWAALSDSRKEFALIEACRVLETLRCTIPRGRTSALSYTIRRNSGELIETPQIGGVPVRYYYYQALQFPRNVDLSTTGELYIPEGVKMAQCDQAVHLLTADISAMVTRLSGVGRESMSVGGISIEQAIESLGSVLSPMVIEYMRPYFMKSSASLRRA